MCQFVHNSNLDRTTLLNHPYVKKNLAKQKNSNLLQTGLLLRVCIENLIFLFFNQKFKTYVVGTQKNRLNEMVLLSNQNTC